MSSFTESVKTLNNAQRQAVEFGDGPLLIIAGAGSGKTNTLVHRVAHLIEQGTPAEQILLLTFTRKAAEEMLKRATRILDHRCANVSGGTFHAFANIALRRYAKYINLDPNFTIFDRGDCEDLIQRIRKELGFAAAEKRFPKKGTLLSILSKAINTGKSVDSIVTNDFPNYLNYASDISRIGSVYDTYKREMQVMDYDDLLTRFLECVTQHPEIQQKFKDFYRYILVDEYQDTNHIQARLIKAITNDNHNITAVGDDAQSIYSFRGAHFENIMKFPDIFPNTQIIKLEQNYRSTQSILDVTNAVISKARNHYDKRLFSDTASTEKPQIIETANENEQSQFICKKILELREHDVPLSKIAVLIRSGWHSNDLELELKSHNIPFTKMGGFKFVETSHIKDVICYCRILNNPQDSHSWSRILMLMQGCGPAAATKITHDIRDFKYDFSQIIAKHQSKKYIKELQSLLTFASDTTLKKQQPKTILETVMTLYKPLFQLKYDDFTKRQSDIDSLISITERYPTLEAMLVDISLDPPSESQSDSLASDHDDEKLCLSTIHSAKGLEWHTVFILSALDGYIPSFKSLGDLGQLEEERRLMYVALTRAEKKLFIMKPNLDLSQSPQFHYSGMQFSSLSRFLDEPEILESLTEHTSISEPEPQSSFSLPDEIDDDFSNLWSKPSKKSSKTRKYYL